MATTSDPRRASVSGFTAQAAFLLGCVFVVAICFPGLGELPGGIPISLFLMLACLPFWFAAGYVRAHPLDGTASAGAAAILGSAGFLIIWSLLSALHADAPFRAGRYVANLSVAFAVYLMVVGTVTRLRLRLYLDVLAVALAATCLVSLIAFFLPPLHSLIFQGTDRAFGFFKNPNQFGMAISAMVPVVTALMLGDRRGRLMRGVCLLLLLFGLIASGSKTNLMLSVLTFLTVLCVYSTIAFSGARRVTMIGFSILVAAAVVGGGLLLLKTFNPRALRLLFAFFEQGELHSIATRSQIWRHSFEQFMMQPLLGQGAGQEISLAYRNELIPHSHNVLLDYLRTLGLPGLLGLLVILGSATWVSLSSMTKAVAAKRSDTRDRVLLVGLGVSCFAYIAANMSSDSMGPSTSPFFWLILYLGFAARGLLHLPVDSKAVPRRSAPAAT